MEQKKRRRLTRKQAALARARVKDPDATLEEIGLKAVYKDTPAQSAHRALQAPHVQDRVRELMDASPKLRMPSLLKKLEEGLEAKEVKFFAEKGVVQDKRVTTDYPTRHRYLDTALGLQGALEKRVHVTADLVPSMSFEEAIKIITEAGLSVPMVEPEIEQG